MSEGERDAPSRSYQRLLRGEIEPAEYVAEVKREVGMQLAEQPEDPVWIPAVPLPFMGVFTDTCACGKKFRAWEPEKRSHAYELHWRRVHEPLIDPNGPRADVCVTRQEAARIYAEVDG